MHGSIEGEKHFFKEGGKLLMVLYFFFNELIFFYFDPITFKIFVYCLKNVDASV